MSLVFVYYGPELGGGSGYNRWFVRDTVGWAFGASNESNRHKSTVFLLCKQAMLKIIRNI